MKRMLALLFCLCVLFGAGAVAEAKTVRYHSRHPLPHKLGGGFCYIEVPHVHAFAPGETRLYRMHDDEYYFVGDPTPFAYDGPRYAFYGPHPVAELDVDFGEPVYCYLDGPHYHWYQPMASARFEFRGGAYWYVGDFEPVYYRARPRYVVINEVYRPMVYTRPVVDVTVAPPAYRAAVIAAPPAVSAGVHVTVPPPPSLHFGVSVGGPPPPVVRERVIVAEPPPTIVRERVIVAEPPPRVIVHERERVVEHHDNGRHEGWFKHKRKHGKHEDDDD